MKLIDVLRMIDEDAWQPEMRENKRPSGKIFYDMDSRPESVWKICLCFMSEEETWVTVNIRNEILIPWYECEVLSFQPGAEYTLEVWLKETDYYIEKGYTQYLYCTKAREDK